MHKANPVPAQIPVMKQALIARINRRLKPDNQMLHVARSRSARFDFGEYFVSGFTRER